MEKNPSSGKLRRRDFIQTAVAGTVLMGAGGVSARAEQPSGNTFGGFQATFTGFFR